jgi:FdhD protein
MDAITGTTFQRVSADGVVGPVERPLASEVPIAIEVNGIGYAVLMASPADLEDLAWGFALAERLIATPDEVVDCLVHEHGDGVLVRLTLVELAAARAVERVRHRVSESSCGLCGIENLEQAIRPLPPVTARFAGEPSAVFAALAALRDHQPLNRATGAVHAAAACGADGSIRLVREDVGRHNAFDKLIGAMLRAGEEWDGGFALLTSRCSYELVEKAALARCPLLATISAPTALAVRRAEEAGVRLALLARPDAVLLR